jgi:thiol:disulfide interchange protein
MKFHRQILENLKSNFRATAFSAVFISLSFVGCTSAVDRISEENKSTATKETPQIVQDKDPNSVQFYRIPLKEAFEMARKENKLVFVDFYADWCQPCKMMDKNVFTVPEVFQFFNTTFINVKLDVEDKAHGSQAAADYRVAAMPTFMVIHPDEGVRYSIRGYRDAKSLMMEVQDAL